MKISVVIDTSVLRKHKSLETEEIQLLGELSRVNALEFYIPEMVEKEILSQQLVEYSDYYDNVISVLDKLKRRTKLENPSFNGDILKYQENKRVEIQLIKKKWVDFIREKVIHRIRFSSINTSSVINDYVEGNPPYSTAKSRKDIPDSFILHSILSINNNEIHFICCDNKLSDAATNHEKIKIYESVETFLELPEVKAFIKELEKFESVKEQFDIIKSEEELIKDWTSSHLDNSIPIDLYTLKGTKSKNEDKLSKVLNINWLDIQFNNARLYGNKQIVVPILIKINCLIEYTKSKDVFIDESKLPWFELFRKEVDVIEKDDIVLIREPYSGTLTTALNVNIEKPFELTEDRVKFSDVRKRLLVSDTINKIFKNTTKPEQKSLA